MDPPTSFSSLPPELVTKICRDSGLQKKDLIALRLTSKSQGIHISASKEFAERYFKNVRLVYTHYSLRTFMEICKHPVYGSAVRKVQLSYARFVPDCFEEESKDQFDRIMLDTRHEYLDNIRLLVNRCDEEENLERSGDAKYLLAAAFTALSQWNHSLEIAVSSEETGALGQSRLYSPRNIGKNAHWECDILGTVDLLYHAAIEGTCVVEALQIQGDVWDNLVDTSSDSLSSLAQLPELKLDIWAAEEDNLQVAGLDDMVSKLLKNAAHLKTLHLDGPGFDDEDHKYLRRIFSMMSRMRLETITLTRIDLDQFKPLKNRIKTLRHLELVECEVEDSFMRLLLSIQKNFPRLEYLRISGISRAWLGSRVEFEGVQEINDGIDKLMKARQNYHDNPGWTIPWDSDED
ncbi:hypothetical protein KCU93_g1970, partial [Aureobasidium melanogenum]